MRTLPASSVLVPLSSGASATINPPFVPPSGVVDHVVTVVDTIAGRRAPWDGVRRLTHHAGWTRIEWVQEGRSKVRGFAGPGTTVLLSLPFDVHIDVPPNMLMIHRTCEYVEVALPPGFSAEQCRTRDGIVLRERPRSGRQNKGEAEAVEIRRGGTSLPPVISQSSALDPARWGFLP